MTKKPEDVLYELKMDVEKEFFKENPFKKFPEDFLSAKAKEELAERVSYPYTFEPGVKITGRNHRIRRGKIDMKKAIAAYAFVKEMEAKSTAKYEEMLLPMGELKLKFEKKVQICFCRKASPSGESGAVLLEFGSYERAKYVLYARKEGQFIYKVPKSEIVVKRAVQKYEKYLEEIREKLKRAFIKRGAEKTIAEGLAEQVLEERIENRK